jgi:DHA1 family bicyclomycin/chloramphenicol resistance-like MFS transporter
MAHSDAPKAGGRELGPTALIALLASATAIGPLSMQILVPSLPFIQRDFGVTPGVVILTISLSMVAIALSNLIFGPLSDRYGRKPVLLIGIVIGIVASIAAAFAQDIESLIFFRFFQAAGATSGMVIARAVVRDKYDIDTASSLIGKLTAIMVVAPMFAPSIGGILTDFFGWRSIFFAVAGASMIVAVLIYSLLKETNFDRVSGGGIGVILTTLGLLRIPKFRAYAVHTSATSTLFFSFLSSAPFLMSEVLHRPATEYGLWFIGISIGFMISSFTAGNLGKKYGGNKVILGATLLGVIGSLVALACAFFGTLSPLIVFGPAGIVLLGSGAAMPNAQAAAMNAAGKRAGGASGLSGALQMTLSAIVAQLVGTFQDGTILPMAIAMGCGALVALSATYFIFKYEKEDNALSD